MPRIEPASQPEAPRTAMVHVHDPRVRWSVPAIQVARIASAIGWSGAPPRDLLAGLGPPPRTGEELYRVLIVTTRSGEVTLLAAGPIAIIDVTAAEVLPLPALLTDATRGIPAIIVAPDASLSLLLDPTAVPAVIASPEVAVVRNHA